MRFWLLVLLLLLPGCGNDTPGAANDVHAPAAQVKAPEKQEALGFENRLLQEEGKPVDTRSYEEIQRDNVSNLRKLFKLQEEEAGNGKE